MISVGDKVTSTAIVNCSLMPISILEKIAQFQLEVSVNDNVIFFPREKLTDFINTIHEPSWGRVGGRGTLGPGLHF